METNLLMSVCYVKICLNHATDHASVPRTHATTHPRSHTTQADYAQPRGSTTKPRTATRTTQAPRRLHIEITLVHTRLPSENASFASLPFNWFVSLVSPAPHSIPLTPWYLFLGILTPCTLWVDSPLMQCLVLERMGQHAVSIHPVHDDFMWTDWFPAGSHPEGRIAIPSTQPRLCSWTPRSTTRRISVLPPVYSNDVYYLLWSRLWIPPSSLRGISVSFSVGLLIALGVTSDNLFGEFLARGLTAIPARTTLHSESSATIHIHEVTFESVNLAVISATLEHRPQAPADLTSMPHAPTKSATTITYLITHWYLQPNPRPSSQSTLRCWVEPRAQLKAPGPAIWSPSLSTLVAQWEVAQEAMLSEEVIWSVNVHSQRKFGNGRCTVQLPSWHSLWKISRRNWGIVDYT